MRSQTKSAVGLLSIGVIAASYQLGAHANQPIGETVASPTATGSGSPAPESGTVTAESGSTAASAAPATTDQGAATSTAAGTSQSSASSTATKPTTAEPTTKAPAAKTVSKTSTAVNYKYGTIQLEVVKSGSTIKDINLIQATTEGREYAQVPPILVQAALAAQGSNFGNISRATFVTNAFKQALDDALAKF